MPRICLLALLGLPGAGKTSLCRWLLQHAAELDAWQVLHLCYDDYLAGGSSYSYKQQRRHIHTLLSRLIDTLPDDSNNNNNYLILCDDNHYYRSMRYALYQLARRQRCSYAQLYVATPLAACLLANEARGVTVPPSVIEQMQARLQPPGDAAWECHSLTLTQPNFDAATQRIQEFAARLLHIEAVAALPLTPAPQQAQSTAHALDLLLRGRIQQLMQRQQKEREDPVQRAARGRALNAQRRQILQQFGRQTQGSASNVQLTHYVNLLN
ncbi:hypothetical protein KR222_008648 [Zaprionus bogoriensis]|nr:hypothetical protein KR222_008648 [Zaprionus bogoriensis]